MMKQITVLHFEDDTGKIKIERLVETLLDYEEGILLELREDTKSDDECGGTSSISDGVYKIIERERDVMDTTQIKREYRLKRVYTY